MRLLTLAVVAAAVAALHGAAVSWSLFVVVLGLLLAAAERPGADDAAAGAADGLRSAMSVAGAGSRAMAMVFASLPRAIKRRYAPWPKGSSIPAGKTSPIFARLSITKQFYEEKLPAQGGDPTRRVISTSRAICATDGAGRQQPRPVTA